MSSQKILFIDGQVESPDSLIAGIDPSIEVVMLNDHESGLVQMARVLQGRQNVGTVHVMSHGAPGGIWLGNGPVTTASLAQDGQALTTIRENLAPGADILLYGCDVAAGEQGLSFIDALAKATGADVAASIDATGKGNPDAQGDWSLEANTGPIESVSLDPTDYQHDLGYWQYVGLLYGANPWSINKGSWYTARFDSDGGKYGKGGVGTKVGSNNISNLYQSRNDWGAELVDFTFKASDNAINGSPWYINNWDWDAGYAILWGAYANNTPWQLAAATGGSVITSSTNTITIRQGSSYTVNLKNLVSDDYYTTTSDFWKYFRGASATNTSYATMSGQSFLVGNNSDKVVTYTASNAASLKGTILLGTVRYNVDDGFDYSRWGSLNPDYYSAYSRYKQAGFVTYIYGEFNNDNVTWTGAPTTQTWISPSRNEFNFARGAQDPDSADSVVGYSFVGIQQRTGTDGSGNPTYGTSTQTLPSWLKLSGTTFYIENLAPEYSDQEYLVTVTATSSDTTTINKSFKLLTGSKSQLNDAPSSAGNSVSLNEDSTYTFDASKFNFTDRDNTVGKSTSVLAANGAALQSVKIVTLPDASKGVLKLAGVDVAINASIAVADLGTLTFVPVADAYGTASFTYKVNDGIDDASAPATMTLNIVSVNDLPVIHAYSAYDSGTSIYSGDVATLAATIADTSAADTSFAASSGALSGYLKATDVESITATLTIVGGSASGGVITKVGSYGSLALTSSTGAWVYTPNATAVNRLSAQALDVFTVKATDGQGGSSTKNVTITVNAVNDTPVAILPDDQTFSGSGAWTYTIPADTFSDAEGDALTYSATLDGVALPTWLSFDASTRSFKGTPPDDTTYALKVTAAAGAASVDASFNLVVGNRAPVLTNPADYVSKTTHEVTTVTFTEPKVAGTVITVGNIASSNVPITLLAAGSLDAETIEDTVAAALQATDYTVSHDDAANTVTLVATSNGVKGNLSITGTAAAAVTVTTTNGTAGTPQTVVLTFASGAYGGKTLDIGGWGSIALPVSTAAIAQQIAAASYTGYSTTVSGSTVKFIASGSGDLTNITVTGVGNTLSTEDGSTAWSYTVPSNLFVDPDGDALAYTITFDPVATGAVTVNGNILSGDGTTYSGKILVSASDGNTHTVSTSIGLQVHAGTPTVSLATGTLPGGDGTVTFANGQGSFSYTLPADLFAVEGAQPTYSAKLATGTVLPAWLSFDPVTQTFSGNPPGSVVSPVSVKVKAEIDGLTAVEQTLNLTVANADDALVLLSAIGNQTITSGWNGYTLPAANTVFSNPENISASEPVTGYTQAEYFNGSSWVNMSSANASGIVFTPATGKFTGYPASSAASLRVRVTGETGANSTGTTEFNFLLPANSAGTGTLSGTGNVGQTLTVSVSDADGATGTKTHEWQISKDSGTTWVPIASSGSGSTYQLTQAEAKSSVRVTSYYTDDRGHTEIVESNALTVSAGNVVGQVSILGTPVPGDNLFAQVTDANGINGTVTYQWQRGDTANGAFSSISGATSANYTLQNADSGKFIQLVVSYSDADGFAESITVAANSGNAMRLAPIAPVATDDTGPELTENYGVVNATVGTATSTGNVLTDGADDSDANKAEAGDTTVLSVAEILLGSVEGVGDVSTQTGDRTFSDTTTIADNRSYTLQGLYGTIVMSYNGSYTYTLDQNNPSVQALAEGQTLTEVFNYKIDDGKPAFLSDSATLTFTINGKNDAPTITVRVDKAIDANGAETTTSLPFASVLEDAATYIPTNKLVFTDPDMGATGSRIDHDSDAGTPAVNNNFVVTLSVNSGRLTVPDAAPAGISIVGSDTSKLTIKGPMVSINSWLSADVIKYLSAPNAVSDATLTVTADDGYGVQSSTGHTIVIAGQNDAPVLDMNGSNGAGFAFNVLFRPRGDAVSIVDTDVTISDPDPSDRIIGATVSITSGALDNQFGTTFETLSTSYADTFTLNGKTFKLTGNGTPNLSIEGEGEHADYVTILKTIKYVNDNPNAYGGEREVTIRLTDKSTQLLADGTVDTASRSDSNKAILISAESSGNAAVAAGQRILVDGVDSGNLIAEVLDSKNYIVNKPLKLLTPTSEIKLYKTAVVASVPSATTLVLQVGDEAIKAGQVIRVDGTQKAVVQSVSTPLNGVTTVTTVAAHNITASAASPVTATFETTLPLTEIKSTKVDHVANNVSASTTLRLSDIDIYIEPGQRIFVNGTDSGKTVSSVAHDATTKTTVTASTNMSVLSTDNITFRTFASNTSPDARALVNNFWTTEVDLNGILSSGRDYETGFTEGQAAGIEIAAASASLDNQVSKIRTLVVDLSNPKDGDVLLVNAAYTIGLLGRGITSALSNSNHTVTITAIDQTNGVSSADMQMALRSVQFKNTSENPDVTPRILNVTVTDVTGETGVSAKTTIFITPVNDAPTLTGDFAATLNEGGVYALNSVSASKEFIPADLDNDVNTLTYTITSLPAAGLTLFRDSNGDNTIDPGEALAVGAKFTHGEVTAGVIKVRQSGADRAFVGFTQTEAQILVNALQYENTKGTDGLSATQPSSGMRKITLASTVTWDASGAETSTTLGTSTSEVIETATVSTVFSGLTLTDPGANGYKSITFKVTDVLDGAAEQLKFGSFSVPLKLGSYNNAGTVYTVTTDTEVINTVTKTFFLVTVAKTSYALGLDMADGGQDGSLPVPTSVDFTVTPVNDAPTITATAASNASYTEGSVAPTSLFQTVAVSTGDTSGPAQTIASVTVTVAGVQNGADEKLHLGDQAIALTATASTAMTVELNSQTYSVSKAVSVSNGVATVTLTGSQSAAVWQALLSSLAYSNASSDPGGASRKVTITGVTDSGSNTTPNVNSATLALESTVGVVAVNVAPIFDAAKPFTQTVLDGATQSIGSNQMAATDADGTTATAKLSYSLLSLPAKGKLFVDANQNGVADFGEQLVLATGDTQSGQYRKVFTQADLDNNLLSYQAAGTSTGSDVFTVSVSDGIADAISRDFTVSIIPASTVRGAVNTASATDVFTNVSVAPLPAGQTIKSLTFTVSGVVDPNEQLTIGGTAVALIDGTSVTTVIAGSGTVTYTVSVDAQGKATVVVTDNAAPGFTNTAAATLIDSITYSNTSTTPTAGSRVVELTSMVNYTSSGQTMPETPIQQGTVTTTPTNPVTDIAAGTSITSSTDGSQPLFTSVDVNMPSGEVINTLTFTVDNVLDGNKEVLTISGTEIALGPVYPHSVSGTGVTYTVTLGQDGQVLVTAVYASALSEATIEATLASVRYENNEVPATAGQRLISLASMGDSAHPNDAIAVDLMGVVNVKPSLDPFGITATTALDNAVPPGGLVQSLTFTVDGVVDVANEVLKINGQEIPLTNGTTVGPIDGCTYTVAVVNGKATVTVTAAPALSESQAQTLLDSVTYSNQAEPPTNSVKTIELTQVGVLATPTATSATSVPITGTEVNTTVGNPTFDPFSAAEITQANAAITGATTALTFTVTGVKDGASEVLKFGAVTVPLVNGTVGPIEGVTYTVTVVNGTATVVASGLTTEAQGEALVEGMVYQNTATPATTGERTVNLTTVTAGSTPTSVNLGGAVQILGELPTPQSVDPFGSAAVTAVDNAVPNDSTVGSLTFTVSGVVDGASEVFTVNGQAVPLVAGTITVDGVTYAVTVTGGTATITVSKASPGFTEAQAKALVDGASYTNTDATPTAGAKTITLISMDVITSGTSSPVSLSDVSSGVVIGGGALSPFSAADITAANAAITGTPASLTFTVAGVKDGANEVLKFGNTVVPLVDGTVGPIAGITYTVTVVNGTATVVATGMTSDSAAESLVAGMTYQNTDANPTVGERTVSLSMVGTSPVTGVSGSAQLGSGSVPNSAPVVTVNGFTMLEGGVVNVTKDMLSASDADDAVETLRFTLTGLTDATLFRDSNYNGVINEGEAIGISQSFAYQDIVNGVLKIRHDGSQPSSNTLSVAVSDGTTRVTGSHAFTVTNVNDAPVGLPNITGQAKRAMVLTANTGSIQDADLFNSPPNFAYQWKADGVNISGATSSTYTVARAEIGKKITVQVSYTDAQSHAESVLSFPTEVVQNVNEAPTLTAGTGGNAISVAEGGSVTLTTSQVVAVDGDGLGSNHVFTLAVAPTHGTLYRDQNGDANLDAGEELANNSQFAWTDLATGKIRFKHDGSEESDSLQLKISDSEAQTDAVVFSITRTAVNDAPVILGLNTVSGASVVNDVLTYDTTGARKLLDQGLVYASITDSDSSDFAAGVLRVSITQNRNAAKDALSIENISLGAHTVSVDATDTDASDGINVKYDSTVIGTFKGGTGANDLEVTFNSYANVDVVAAVIRAVAFTNLERVPANSGRVVSFELSDGDGGTSAPVQVSVNLTASASPIIQNNASEIYVQENNRDVGYFVALDPGNKALTYSISTATGSNNEDRGKFVISAAGLLQFIAAPDYENPTDVGADNIYHVIVKATNSDGLTDESILAVNVTNATSGAGENEDTPPSFVVATVNGAQMGLTFADANLLDGTHLPSTAQFAVTSNGQSVPVTGYLVNTATKVVTLTLGRSIAYGETVLVSYTDPTTGNDVNTLQDIYGNDVASFSGQIVLVLTPQPVVVVPSGGGAAPVPVIVPKTDSNVVTAPKAENAVKSIVYVAADGTKKIIEGDGNGDGISDSLQNAVLSVSFKLSDKVSVADSTVPESFITLVTASVSGKVTANEVAAITEINQKDAPANLPDYVKMPLGLIGFKSTIPTIGANGSFSLYVDPALPFNGYWKQNGQGVWTNLATSAYGGNMVTEDSKTRIDFVIQDGGEFDEDGVANGVIVDPGALGELPLSVMGAVANMPAGSVWF